MRKTIFRTSKISFSILFLYDFSDIFFCPEMTLPLRYGASVKDFTEKVKQELKGTKYVNLMSVNSIILIIRMTQFWFNKSQLE